MKVTGAKSVAHNDLSLLPDLPAGQYLVGQVEDNGHGIGSEDLENLFTRFYRGWAKHSQIPGTGLGLALVQELLMTYGGGIRIRSELEVGSQFTFWIPIYLHKDIDHDQGADR